jgi:hypothetical protein
MFVLRLVTVEKPTERRHPRFACHLFSGGIGTLIPKTQTPTLTGINGMCSSVGYMPYWFYLWPIFNSPYVIRSGTHFAVPACSEFVVYR